MFDLFNEADKPLDGEMFTGPTPGLLETVGKGFMRGGLKVPKAAALVGSLAFPEESEQDPARIIPRKEDFFRFIDERLDPAEKYWSVDTSSMSTAKKIVSAMSELPLQLVGGGSVAATSMGLNVGADMVNQGVDANTAVAAATLTGGAMAGMIALPQAGRTIKETLALIASNPVLGAGSDFATKALLKSQGYDKQAKQIDPFDIPARSVDLLLGGIFGGVAHYGKWRATAPTAVIDAIDTVEATRHRENSNPFQGSEPQHGAALDSAINSLTNGEPVNVKDHIPTLEPEPLTYTAEKFRADAQAHFNLTTEQADVTLALIAARAKAAGENIDSYISKRISAITSETPEGAALYQGSMVQPFYSKLLAEVEGLQQEKWSASDLLNKLSKTAGIKAEEIAWTGLDDFLKGKQSVTKEEVRSFLDENRVQVEEVEKAGKSIFMPTGEELGVRYDTYTLPGGENYRELLLTLPDSTYKSSHFDEPGILAHIRFNERTGSDGERVLHLEEIQSDWHQQGRDHGYQKRYKLDELRLNRAESAERDNGIFWIIDAPGQSFQIPRTKYPDPIDAMKYIAAEKRAGSLIPDAPFKKSWQELALKRMLRYATEHGFDRLTWTTGEQQSARYDLSKKLEKVTFDRAGTIYAVKGQSPKGEVHDFGTFNESDLADAVGKDLATRMKQSKSDHGSFEGVALKIGGEGMKGFYDKIIPDYLRKFGKKFNAKVEDMILPEAGNVHSMNITDAMRNALNYEGQPLFQGDKGAVSFLSDGRAVIHALQAPDFSTLVHEIGHVFRRDLPRLDQRILDTWMFSQVPGSKWETKHEEVFARTFERYLAEGKAPSKELETIFQKFKTFLLEIYQRITGTAIDQKISPEIRLVFDRLLYNSAIKTDTPPEVLAIRAEIETQKAELETELATFDLPEYEPPVIRQRTAAQEAASEKITAAARKVNREKDSVITAISKLGGLDYQGAKSQWGRMVEDSRKALADHVLKETRRFGAVFKKDGMPLDRMRDMLIQENYLPKGASIEDLHDLIDRASRGSFARSAEYAPDIDALEQAYYAEKYTSAADLYLQEQGDFQINDGFDADGKERTRSAQEMLDEARAEIAMEESREALYQRAAFCLNLG